MKSIKLMLAMLSALMMLFACSTKDDPITPDPDPVKPETEDPTYLVMLYGLGGGNLDPFIVSNILQLMNEGSSDKVKFTIQYKLSAKEQQMYDDKFGGVQRLTGDDNQQLQNFNPEVPILQTDIDYSQYLNAMTSTRFAEKDYNMSCSEALTDFINWSKKLYPKAQRTILILNSHGSGWNLETDGKDDAVTRSIFTDDNLSNKYLTLNAVVNGIKAAGNVDVIYADACLMSKYENLYGYAQVAKYMMGAIETTPGKGGNYMRLLSLLKKTYATDSGLESALNSYIDFCTSNQWWSAATEEPRNHDLGLYDLTKLTNNCTPVLKQISQTLTEKFISSESINPTAEELPLGNQFAPYIRQAVKNCMVAYYNEFIEEKALDFFLPYVQQDGLQLVYGNKYLMHDLIEWLVLCNTPGAQQLYEDYPKEFIQYRTQLTCGNSCSFSLTDLLRNLCNSLDAVGAQNNPFNALRQQLLAAIKASGHISCTKVEDKPGIDQAYELCSPGITIVPLNEYLFTDDYIHFKSHIPSVEDGIRYYQSTLFDQQTGWSSFLQIIDVHPNATNPMRKYVK